MKKEKRILIVLIMLSLASFIFSCDSKIRNININGTYVGTSAMGYEAVVEKGTITIYSTSFFEKEIYWYGTCHANELDEENKLISKRIERERKRDIFGFGFGFSSGINESRAREKVILFTEDSLTFIYDFSGMSVSQVTLYKENAKRKKPNNDSNAEKLPEIETQPETQPNTEPSIEEKYELPADNSTYSL